MILIDSSITRYLNSFFPISSGISTRGEFLIGFTAHKMGSEISIKKARHSITINHYKIRTYSFFEGYVLILGIPNNLKKLIIISPY
jgi:hypothetical protein